MNYKDYKVNVEDIIEFALLGITNKQYLILEKIKAKEELCLAYSSMKNLAKDLKMSLPRLAYHIRGNKESLGLVKLKLLQITKNKQNNIIQLTELSRFILQERILYAKCHEN